MTMRITTVMALAAGLSACSAAGEVVGTSSGTTGATIGLSNAGGSTSTVASAASSASTGASTSAGAGTTSGSGASTGASTTGSASGTTSGGSCPGTEVSCNGSCCPANWGCVNGACCESPCNGTCCNSEQACATVTGVTQCMQTCAESSRCPANAPCCIPTDGGANVCIDADPSNGVCICETSSDCDAGSDTACCAPAVDPSGHPIGPYVCKPNDANAYDCCYGTFNSCSDGNCCIKDGPGNEFCATPCTGPGDCPGSVCQDYDFSITTTTCSIEGDSQACGPN